MSKSLLSMLFAGTLVIGIQGCSGSPAGTSPVANPFGIPTEVGIRLPETAQLKASAAYRTQAGVPSIAKIIRDNASLAHDTSAFIKLVLAGVARAKLVPGIPVTFPDGGATSGKYTVLLSVLSDHAVISIGDGSAATGSAQIFGLAYTSPTKGHAVFRFKDHPSMGTLYLAEDYDATAGHASIDGHHAKDGQLMHGHWELSRFSPVEAQGAEFRMQVSAHLAVTDRPQENTVGALTAAFLPDHSAAARMGVQNGGTGGQLLWMPVDGLSWADPAAPRDFYMDARGQDLPRTQASESLQKLLPAESSVYRPFPADATTVIPATDARFAFPAAVATPVASLSTSV